MWPRRSSTVASADSLGRFLGEGRVRRDDRKLFGRVVRVDASATADPPPPAKSGEHSELHWRAIAAVEAGPEREDGV